MGFIGSLFGQGAKLDYKQLVTSGAIILDVRSPAEYKGGHIKGSVNVPLEQVKGYIPKLKQGQVVITVCASGMRSGVAKSTLANAGFEVHNGGGWAGLERKLNG